MRMISVSHFLKQIFICSKKINTFIPLDGFCESSATRGFLFLRVILNLSCHPEFIEGSSKMYICSFGILVPTGAG